MRYCAHFIIASKKFILLMLVSGGCIKKEEHPNVRSISLPTIPYIHRIYMVLANPTNAMTPHH